MEFGKTLQDLRKAAGVSQSELAERSGTSIDSLRNWEQGRALPKIDAATRLARALGVSLDELAFDGKSASDSPEEGRGGKLKRPTQAAAPSTPPVEDLEAEAKGKAGPKKRRPRK